MKSFYYLFLLFFLMACYNNEKSESKPLQENTSVDTLEKVAEIVRGLPEYKESAMFIDSISNHENSIEMVVEKRDSGAYDYYASFGYENENKYEAYFHLFIKSGSGEVFVEEVLAGGIIPIEEWRLKYK